MGGINATLDLDCKLSAAYIIPFIPTSISLTNLELDVVVSTTSDDKVHWVVKENTKITLGDFDIQMKTKFFT